MILLGQLDEFMCNIVKASEWQTFLSNYLVYMLAYPLISGHILYV